MFNPGDYVKIEFKDDTGADSEWMWVRVETVDYEQRYELVESEPVQLENLIPRSQETAELRAHLSAIGALVESETE